MSSKAKSFLNLSIGLAFLLMLPIAVSGCFPVDDGDDDQVTGKAIISTVFTGDGTALADKILKSNNSEVLVEDLESLMLDIDRIYLNSASCETELCDGDGDCDCDCNNDDEDGDDEKCTEGSKVLLFEGPARVNILDLSGVSELLATTEVPAGTYVKISLEISNPELVFKDEPDTVYTNIQLTANDRLFISEQFTVEDGESKVLLLDFGGIHLVETGTGNGNTNHKYVLTPQLRADVSLVSPESATIAFGSIGEIDYEANTFILETIDADILVSYADDVEIFLLTDPEDAPTGIESDLVSGEEMVSVTGTLFGDLTMAADSIRIME